jgi:hypothetical protein
MVDGPVSREHVVILALHRQAAAVTVTICLDRPMIPRYPDSLGNTSYQTHPAKERLRASASTIFFALFRETARWPETP